jgi:hypothetical protein
MSLFPQVSINNPNNSAERGITPRGASLILPLEFSKKLGAIDLNWEVGSLQKSLQSSATEKGATA